MPNNTFIFLRHAETKVDRNIKISQWTLTEKGKKDALKLSQLNVFKDFNIIITSNEEKAYQTATPLAEKLQKEINLRKYLQLSFYEVFNLLQEFSKYAEDKNDLLEVYKIVFPEWVKILSITMPHLCEELWEKLGNKEFLSETIWTDFNSNYVDNELEREFGYISDFVEDILNILKIVKSSNSGNIYVYTSPKWKQDVYEIVSSKKGDFKEIL